ncbi:MAG: hypothetical protein JXR43_04360 [Burkholderiaceae bacterium]|nr:hypothetical protein [Burkholderiaceae bacterium]
MAHPTRLHPRLRTAAAPGVAVMAEDGAPLQWVHLIPAATFAGRDGRGPYTLDAAAVLAAFATHGADLPVDYEHQSLTAAEKAGPVPAAGWIVALEPRDDGLWAQVRWTPQAAELLAAQQYRYLSPVFRFDPASGRVAQLLGAGLTRTPNLMLQAAASTGDAMDELLERLVYILNMPVTSTPDELAAELQKLIDRLTASDAAMQAAKAEIEALKTAAQSQQPSQPDPAQFVPINLHRQTAEALAALQSQVAEAAATEAVTAAMSAGKLAPAMKDWALDYARRDAAGFAQFAQSAPQLVSAAATQHAATQPADGLTDSDREAAQLLGLSLAAFAQAKAAQQNAA